MLLLLSIPSFENDLAQIPGKDVEERAANRDLET
jgi:hypothetical protein